MKRKLPYKTPAIMREVHLQLEGGLLDGSLVDHSDITSVGQQVKDYDFSEGNSEGFNFTWED